MDNLRSLQQSQSHQPLHIPHPHLIRVHKIFEDKKHVHIVTELCTGGELYDLIVKWKKQQQPQERGNNVTATIEQEETCAIILRGILDALDYLHSVHHLAHRDLKASNFLFQSPILTTGTSTHTQKLQQYHVKIIDFGLSRKVTRPPIDSVELNKLNDTSSTYNDCHRGTHQLHCDADSSIPWHQPQPHGVYGGCESFHSTRQLPCLSSCESSEKSPTTNDEEHPTQLLQIPGDQDPRLHQLITSLSSSLPRLPESIYHQGMREDYHDEQGGCISALSSPVASTRDARALVESDDDDHDDDDLDYALRAIHNGRLGSAYNDNSSIYLTARQDEVKELVSIVSQPDKKANRLLDRDPRSLYGVMTSEVGTPFFVAPEVLLDKEYTCLCDIWSIGVIAYLLLSKGHFPTNTYDERECIQTLMDSEFQVQFPQQLWHGVSQEAQDFCAYLLQKDPRKRPTAKESLDHPWLRARMASASARRVREKEFFTP